MPARHDKKLLFIHIPRTGGTSIREALQLDDYYSPTEIPSPQHLTLQELQQQTGNTFSDYFKFTVTRDEDDRMDSEYRWRRQRVNVKHPFNDDHKLTTFEEFMKFVEEVRKTGDYSVHTYDHFRPQEDYLYGLDKIFHSLTELEEHFNIQLPHRNHAT